MTISGHEGRSNRLDSLFWYICPEKQKPPPKKDEGWCRLLFAGRSPNLPAARLVVTSNANRGAVLNGSIKPCLRKWPAKQSGLFCCLCAREQKQWTVSSRPMAVRGWRYQCALKQKRWSLPQGVKWRLGCYGSLSRGVGRSEPGRG